MKIHQTKLHQKQIQAQLESFANTPWTVWDGVYGCGDFLNDYEGIHGYERYRDDLALMYFADLDPTNGSLHALKLVPLQIKNFRLSIPSWRDIEWIQQTLDGRCQQFGTRVILDSERQLVVIGPRAGT